MSVQPEDITSALLDLARKVGGEAEKHTLHDALVRWRSARCVPGLVKRVTLSGYLRAARAIDERWGAADVRDTDWRREAAEYFALRDRSALLVLEVLRFVLVHAQRLGWRSEPHGVDTVIRKCRYQPREAVYTAQQLRDFLAALDECDRTRPIRVPAREVLRALVYTGCRVNEIARLQHDEVGPTYLRLRDSKTGARTVPICEQAITLLARQNRRDGWVFPSVRKGPVSSRSVLKAFHEARELAGIRDGVVHTLRHSFCTIAMRNGVPQSVVQQIMGHSASWITSRYIHPNERDARLGCAVVANAIGGAQ